MYVIAYDILEVVLVNWFQAQMQVIWLMWWNL